jgi:hypothetical protein
MQLNEPIFLIFLPTSIVAERSKLGLPNREATTCPCLIMIDTDQQRLYMNSYVISWMVAASVPKTIAAQHIGAILVSLNHFSTIVLCFIKFRGNPSTL